MTTPNTVVIDGVTYAEIPAAEAGCKNVCKACAFYDTACYNHPRINCHDDARPDGRDIIYRLASPDA